MDSVGASDIKQKHLSALALDAALDIWSRTGQKSVIAVTGRSMFPFIRDGDRVLVTHGAGGVRRGDVILFRREGMLIAHRVLQSCETGSTFVTKGDNAFDLDPTLNAQEIVGRVRAVEREGRRMSLETAPWRVVGWLIATGTLAWMRFYEWGRVLKRKLLGPRPNFLAVFVRRAGVAFSSFALKVIEAVVCRWVDDAPESPE